MRIVAFASVLLLCAQASAQTVCTTAHPCQDVLARGLDPRFHRAVYVDAGMVYATTRDGLIRVPTGGRASVMLSATAEPYASSFVFNQTNVCWSDLHAIKCQPLVGKTITTIAAFPSARYITALVRAGSTFYWIRDGEWIESMSTVGGPVTTIAHVQPGRGHNPYDDLVNWLATDGTHLYWASRALVQSRLLGGGPIITMLTSSSTVRFHDFKAVGAELFAVDSSRNLLTLPATGGSGRTLLNPQSASVDQIALDASTVYWIDSFHGELDSIPIGGGTTTHHPIAGSPIALAVDATSLYYLTRQGDLVKITPK